MIFGTVCLLGSQKSLTGGVEVVAITVQTCQVSRCIRRDTHVFEVYLTLSRLHLKSHAFASTVVMLFSSIQSCTKHFLSQTFGTITIFVAMIT